MKMKMKWIQGLGFTLLGVWLIAVNLAFLLDLTFTGRDTIFALLAVAAGVLIILNR